MKNAFLTGFFLGISLIFAIGAQNAFVLRQGILKKNIFIVAFYCAFSDSVLICLGIAGISFFIGEFVSEHEKIIFGIAAIWLFVYGGARIRSAFMTQSTFEEVNSEADSLKSLLLILTIFTFANPHVYLDTIILIGSISQQFSGLNIVFYALGACIASFVWFFGLSYGSRIISPLMNNSHSWQIFDILIATVMFTLSFNLAQEGKWL